MPSDDRRQNALAAVTREREAFQAAVATALEQVRTLVSLSAPHEQLAARAAGQLGQFAAGRIDSNRFGELFAPANSIGGDWISTLRHTQYLLKATLLLADDAYLVAVAPDDDLRDAITRALASLGRVFAAAHAVVAMRAGTFEPIAQEPLLAPLPPERWTRGERAIAPPLVVELDGADLRAGGLEEVLQGTQKIVLLVNGPCPPAALVRLISPGVYVQQCRAVGELQEFTAFEGPGIAAVLSEGAQFSSAPTAGGSPKLQLRESTSECKRRVGRITPFQQNQDLHWLEQLAAAFSPAQRAAADAAPAGAGVEPGDQLAAWLLKQAQL